MDRRFTPHRALSLAPPTGRYQPIASTDIYFCTKCDTLTLRLEQPASDGYCIVYSTDLDFFPAVLVSLEHPVNKLPVSDYAACQPMDFLFLFLTSGAGMC